jgi:hypothetical protein
MGGYKMADEEKSDVETTGAALWWPKWELCPKLKQAQKIYSVLEVTDFPHAILANTHSDALNMLPPIKYISPSHKFVITGN